MLISRNKHEQRGSVDPLDELHGLYNSSKSAKENVNGSVREH